MSKPFLKDGKKYFFNSKKFSSLNSMFGISSEIKKQVDFNLKKQEDYLKSNFIELSDDKLLSFYDMNLTANIKPNQYYGEMFNKVSTLRRYAKHVGFSSPVFLTITPPTWYKPLKQINLGKNRIKMVDNPNFSGCLDYIDLARDYESSKWRKFLNQRIFSDIKSKYGIRPIYMRTYEPMIDGTPHLHIVCFLPPEYLDRFVALSKLYFSSTRFDIKTVFDDDIGGVIAYILKYILKSFSNSKTNKLDDVGYWYAYHRIRRFSTSRTLIPMKIFRLINSQKEFQDLFKVTQMYKRGEFNLEVSFSVDKLYEKDYLDFRSKDFKISEISILVEDIEYGYLYKTIYKKMEKIFFYSIDNRPTLKPKPILHIDKPKPIFVKCGLNMFMLHGEILKKIVLLPSKMSNYDLYRHYQKLDPGTCNLHHFGLVQNELAKRGLIDVEIQSLNDFNTDFNTKIGA